MPGVNIQAPSLKPPRVSLLSSADIINLPGTRDDWWGGISYKKLSASPSQGIDSEFDEDESFLLAICPVDSVNKATWPRLPSERVEPFATYASEACSTWGDDANTMLERARQKVAVGESWTIEHELWFGTGTNNYSFADSSVSLGTGLSPLAGFAVVDAAVARDRGDGRGMVHVTTRTFDLLQQYQLFRREGNVWFSPNDNIVVPGRGYGDSDTPHIYGHPGIVQIAHSEIFTFPKDGTDPAFLNRSTNDIWVVAERVVAYFLPNAVGTDGDTSAYSVTVDLDAAGSGGGGSAPDYTALLTAISAATSDTDTNTDALEALVTALGTNTDTLETLVAATNTALATSDARLANLEDTLTADAATLSNVASSATNVTVAAANANRRGLMIHNDSTAILYIKFGATASTSSYSVKIPADTYWEMSMPIYQGIVDGIWASANGNARVTELT